MAAYLGKDGNLCPRDERDTDACRERGECASCPRDVWQMLQDAVHYFDQCRGEYHQPEAFRRSLTSLVQAVRNVTFRVQNQKSRLPGFDEWYCAWQEMLRSNDVARWAVEARNRVVKQGELHSSSWAVVRLIDSYLSPYERVLRLPASMPTSVLVCRVTKGIPRERLASCVIDVERRWEVEGLSGKEILSAIGDLLHMLVLLVEDFHQRLHAVERGDPAGLLALEPEHAFWPTARDVRILVDPVTLEQRGYEIEEMKRDEETDRVAAERYGSPALELVANPDDPLQFARALLPAARKIMKTDGCHVTMLWLHGPGHKWEQGAIYFRDQLDKYVFWHDLAKRIAQEHQDGLVLIGEVWQGSLNPAGLVDRDQPMVNPRGRREALQIFAASSDGRELNLITPVRRFLGRTLLAETTEVDNIETGFLMPIRRAWGLCAPGSQDLLDPFDYPPHGKPG